jgi:hypothetical protein
MFYEVFFKDLSSELYGQKLLFYDYLFLIFLCSIVIEDILHQILNVRSGYYATSYVVLCSEILILKLISL